MAYQSSVLYEIYDDEVTEQAKINDDIWVVDADATWMNQKFSATFPNRSVEVGIAEQNMVGVAAGIASTGKTVFTHTMATFLTLRAIEQIKVDIIYNHLFNVTVASSFSGVLGGPWGSTHHALEDISYCRTLPYMQVVVPCDEHEVREAVKASLINEKPMYIRLEREEPVQRNEEKFELGKATVFKEGKDVTLIGTGSMVSFSQQASKILQKRGIDAGVIDMHTIKPIDEDQIMKSGKNTGRLITVEEHEIIGGLGSAVAETLAENNSDGIKLSRIGFNDTLVEIVASYAEILDHYQLTPESIANKAEKFVLEDKR